MRLDLYYAVTEIGEGARGLQRTAELCEQIGSVLPILVDQLTGMARLLWHIENYCGVGHSNTLASAWEEDVRTVELYNLPALILAAEHAAEDPSGVTFMGNSRGYWTVVAVRESAGRLIAWADRHTLSGECEEVAS